MSEQAAKAYLDTPEGARFWQRLAEADPRATTGDIDESTIGQITSGRGLPRMEVINEPLTKIVSAGDSVSPFSPFFTKRTEFEDALVKGHNLSERFGLPIKSEATVYDVYEKSARKPLDWRFVDGLPHRRVRIFWGNGTVIGSFQFNHGQEASTPGNQDSFW